MIKGRDLLIYLSIIYESNFDKIYEFISNKEQLKVSEEEVDRVIKTVRSKVTTLLDEDFPKCMLQTWKPPFVLFYYGDLSLLNDISNNIAVIGSRECNSYSVRKTREIVGDLAKDYKIVSGLAAGIDCEAHKQAIKFNGKTIAILGSGIDICFPSNNIDVYREIKKNHLLISEYCNNVAPLPERFPLRNRLIAAACSVVCVMQGTRKSGSSITVRRALELGRDICCLPTEADHDSLTNILIKEGAFLIENAEDVINVMKKY